METAINEMVADLLFSVPAIVLAIFAAFFPNKSTNPAKPSEYHFYQAGGIIMLIPGVIIAMSLGFSVLAKCAPLRAFKYPAQDLWRLLRNPIRKLRKKDPIPQREVHISNFKGWFFNFFGLGIILYVGSWLVWTSFLDMVGSLYCPASLNVVATVLFVYPKFSERFDISYVVVNNRNEICLILIAAMIRSPLYLPVGDGEEDHSCRTLRSLSSTL
ncbi:uncharacterized protein K441DRAFT_15735 [Cenococcum geophilum 1.58]|uniref:uncharacterized protein n=1 Tax=Cenococcum geophilum 1.58 TaxID=794803 RepID=UPI00358EBA1A|nr:hypothetical protein K441DRAFT_15735 [Cenococcum geophilum 1.58]